METLDYWAEDVEETPIEVLDGNPQNQNQCVIMLSYVLFVCVFCSV